MSRSPVSQHSDKIARMFGAIAEHYDMMNWVMTFGQDQSWRRQAADVAALAVGEIAIDVATGTGDLAIELAKRVGDRGHVLGVDFSEPMLARARRKFGRSSTVSFEVADALRLPYSDNSFDAVTCSFGLRNMEDRPAALREMVRVARAGRVVVVLELTPPENELARIYMDDVIPRIGSLLARARDAYSYLPQSVKDFPRAEALGVLLRDAGLERVKYRLLNFGTVALHWGMKSQSEG